MDTCNFLVIHKGTSGVLVFNDELPQLEKYGADAITEPFEGGVYLGLRLTTLPRYTR